MKQSIDEMCSPDVKFNFLAINQLSNNHFLDIFDYKKLSITLMLIKNRLLVLIGLILKLLLTLRIHEKNAPGRL